MSSCGPRFSKWTYSDFVRRIGMANVDSADVMSCNSLPKNISFFADHETTSIFISATGTPSAPQLTLTTPTELQMGKTPVLKRGSFALWRLKNVPGPTTSNSLSPAPTLHPAPTECEPQLPHHPSRLRARKQHQYQRLHPPAHSKFLFLPDRHFKGIHRGISDVPDRPVVQVNGLSAQEVLKFPAFAMASITPVLFFGNAFAKNVDFLLPDG